MRAVIQRVLSASVTIDGEIVSSIHTGLLIFLGIESADSEEDIHWLTSKICSLRIFSDEDGKMNESVLDCDGDILVVSQFTLHAKTKKGNRPSFIHAAPPALAIPLYENFIRAINQHLPRPAQTGEFGADMKVALINDGPVTLWIDTKNKS